MNLHTIESILEGISSQKQSLELGLKAASQYPEPDRSMFEAIIVQLKTCNALMLRTVLATLEDNHINPAMVKHE